MQKKKSKVELINRHGKIYVKQNKYIMPLQDFINYSKQEKENEKCSTTK